MLAMPIASSLHPIWDLRQDPISCLGLPSCRPEHPCWTPACVPTLDSTLPEVPGLPKL